MFSLKKFATFLAASVLSFTCVRAELGDYLVKFGVNGNDRCSFCRINFAQASHKVCYEEAPFPGLGLVEIVRDSSILQWLEKFGNFCFVDLSDSKFPDSESSKGELFCRDCMIKHLKGLSSKAGFKLREFKNRGCFATHSDGTCSVCLNELVKGHPFSQCINKHSFHYQCLKSSFSYVNTLCPYCKVQLETRDLIPNVKFINEWDIE